MMCLDSKITDKLITEIIKVIEKNSQWVFFQVRKIYRSYKLAVLEVLSLNLFGKILNFFL